jgi:hypothetical protein
MEPEWAAVAVALLVGAANLALTLELDRRRRHERNKDRAEIEFQRRAGQAVQVFEQDVSVPLRSSLQDLERLGTMILEAAGHTTESERQRVIRQIFENEKTRVLAAFDRPLASAMLWSPDAGDIYRARLRDLELQIDRTLAELAGSDGLTTTHRISEASRRLSEEVRGFSSACRLWLYEISEALSAGRLQPPPPAQVE